MRINFKRGLFSPVYYRIAKVETRFCLLYGGSDSSKSYSFHQFLIIKSFEDKFDTLIVRKTASTLKDSVYKGIKARINTYNLTRFFAFRWSNEERSITNIVSGAKMVFKGLDDPEKIKSIERIGRVYGEEMNESMLSDHMEINRRVRGIEGIQIFYLFNPVSKHHWLKKHFVDTEKVRSKTTLINVTYKDNPFTTNEDIENLEDLKFININEYNIYALGLWGNPSEGLVWEFIRNFDLLKERKDKIYYTSYENMPDYEFYKIFALDFGGGGGRASDTVDGRSKTVLKEYNINKATRRIYHKLHIYKGYIGNDSLIKRLTEIVGQKFEILADNARSDKIIEIASKGFMIIPAKSKEGKSGAVSSGIDILRLYNHYVHVDDRPEFVEREEHQWGLDRHGDPTGQVLDKYKDITDCDRYGIVFYHLNYNY